jgi:hypothetical protein
MGTGEKVFVGIFGLFLIGLGLYVLLFGEVSALWRYVGGLAILAIGINAVYGAISDKRPWISRIGPLP